MITLDSVSSDRFPPFTDLELVVRPQELPLVVCPDDEERIGFVNLLLGHTPESGGQILHFDQPLTPEDRRTRIQVLRRDESLDSEMSAIENLELLAALRRLKVTPELRQRTLAFAQITNGKLKPSKLPTASRWRLSLALNVLGDWALVIALDPPPEMMQVLPELLDEHRALLVVTRNLVGMDLRGSRVHTLQGGHLDDGASPDVARVAGRRYRLRIGKSQGEQDRKIDPKSLLQTYPGVNVTQVPNGDYVLDLAPEVAGVRVIRLIVQAGIGVESIVDEPGRA